MFTALSTIIVQGSIPENTENILIILFSVFNGFSFAFLLCSLVLCIEILALSSRFMICKAKYHSSTLDEARYNTKLIFGKLKAKDFNYKPVPGEEKEPPFQNIASVGKLQIDDIWKSLEGGTSNMLNERRMLLRKMINTETFDNFWQNHCKQERNQAISCFYLGTGLMLLSVMIYIIAQFIHLYDSPIAAAFGSGLIFLALICGCALKIKISALRPELSFFTEGKPVEVCSDHWISIYFLPHRCTWQQGTIITPPKERVNDYIVFEVSVGGKNTRVPGWRIRDPNVNNQDELQTHASSAPAFLSGKSIA